MKKIQEKIQPIRKKKWRGNKNDKLIVAEVIPNIHARGISVKSLGAKTFKELRKEYPDYYILALDVMLHPTTYKVVITKDKQQMEFCSNYDIIEEI